MAKADSGSIGEQGGRFHFMMEGGSMSALKGRLLRTKTLASASSVDEESDTASQRPNTGGGGRLERVLTTFDLTSLGVGSCVGTGMYIVAGLVAKNVAGPATILSFFIAGMASILSGVCYGEFGVRVPKTTGSAYMYSYVTVGEFVAFLIGWNLILEYMIGSAAGASALSACFDALLDHRISEFLATHVGTVIGKAYPDVLGCLICLVMTAILALGVKGSVRFNTVLNAVNAFVWLFIVVAGFCYADGKNWSQYGFAPYGTSGVLSGAATCFYAFIGIDIIATTGEEARSPSRSIPIAIVVSLVICLTAYISVSMVLTLMIPYYEIHGASSLIDVFVQRGFPDAKYVVATGALASLTVSLLGSMFPMPRVIYAMARDGLLFKFLAQIHERTGTPLIATIVTGVLSALMALFVGLSDLVELMSIGTLLAYTLVSASVLILRYQPTPLSEPPIPLSEAHRLEPIAESPVTPGQEELMVDGEDVFEDPEKRRKQLKDDREWPTTPDQEELMVDGVDVCEDPEKRRKQLKDDRGLLDEASDPSATPPRWYGALPFSAETIESKMAMVRRHTKMLWLRLGFPGEERVLNEATAKIVIICVGLLALTQTLTCLVLVFAEHQLVRGAPWAWLLVLICVAMVTACVVIILRQPQNRKKLRFMAPGVPLLPAAATFMNIYLMLKLPALTWARLAIWICLGLLLYFSYSMWHSNKEHKKKRIQSSEQHPTTGAASPGTLLPDGTHATFNGTPATLDTMTTAGYQQQSQDPIQNGGHHVISREQSGPPAMVNPEYRSRTLPPGAPPSRPPPPRQESIEKYLRSSANRHTSTGSNNSMDDASGQNPGRNGSHFESSPRIPDSISRDTQNPADRRRPRKLSSDECDPFAEEERRERGGVEERERRGQRGGMEERVRSERGGMDEREGREHMESKRGDSASHRNHHTPAQDRHRHHEDGRHHMTNQHHVTNRQHVTNQNHVSTQDETARLRTGASKVSYDASMARPRPKPSRDPKEQSREVPLLTSEVRGGRYSHGGEWDEEEEDIR